MVDHHFKIGVRDRRGAADCVPLSDRQRVARRGTCRSYLSATLEVFPSHTVTTCSGVWPATGPMLSAGVAGPVPATSRMRELDRGSIFQCYCVCPVFAYVQYLRMSRICVCPELLRMKVSVMGSKYLAGCVWPCDTYGTR